EGPWPGPGAPEVENPACAATFATGPQVADEAAERSGGDVMVADAVTRKCRAHLCIEGQRPNDADLEDVGGHAIDGIGDDRGRAECAPGLLALDEDGDRGRARGLTLGDFDARRDSNDVGQREQFGLMRSLRLGYRSERVEIRWLRGCGCEMALKRRRQCLAGAILVVRPRARFTVHD